MKLTNGRGPGYARVAGFLLACFFVVGTASSQSSNKEVAGHLADIKMLIDEALAASQQAESAATVADVKMHTDEVFATVWGVPSGLADPDARGAVPVHDWKTRWQSDTTDFKLETPEKFGVEPAAITDPAKLGIVGRGLYARDLIWADSLNANAHYEHTVASLSNVIGWMRMDYAPARGGMPRVDLTSQWDAPSEFWLSTADTGWIFEVYTQAMNILKTDYGSDVELARRHAADMTALVNKCIEGEDANGNGNIEPTATEGGLDTAVQHARLAGFDVP